MTDGPIAPTSPEQAHAAALAYAASRKPPTPAEAHGLAISALGPIDTGCAPSPRRPVCDVALALAANPPRDPAGMSHRVPIDSSPAVTTADVLAAVEACRVACDGMAARRVTYTLRPAAPPAPGLPDVPELVDGADVDARRARLAHIGELIRGTGELAGLLTGETEAVVARARAALARLV
jgi:hypothetical protein